MTIFETLGVIGIILLSVVIIAQLIRAHDSAYEVVEADPDDPATKELVEQRTAFINILLTHLSVNMGLDPHEMDENSKMINLSPAVSTLTVAAEDSLYTFYIHWDRYVKIKLFRNVQDADLTVRMTKRFWIKDNDINEKKYTLFFDKFKEKAYGNILSEVSGMDDKQFKALAIATTQKLIETQDDETLKTFLYNFIIDFNRNDYNDDQTALINYASILAYILKFHKDEFDKLIKKK